MSCHSSIKEAGVSHGIVAPEVGEIGRTKHKAYRLCCKSKKKRGKTLENQVLALGYLARSSSAIGTCPSSKARKEYEWEKNEGEKEKTRGKQ